jgi:hypothetical protein
MPARKRPSFSARSRKLKRNSLSRKKEISRLKKKLIVFVISILLIASGCLFFISSRKLWNGKDKLSVVIRNENNDVQIVTFDPELGEIVNVIVPKNTQVEVARGLGEWKLGSIWKLSQNEKLEGKLLAETVIRHFKFPIHAWADSPGLGLISKNPSLLIQALLIPYKSNLSIFDKLGIALFSVKVDNSKRTEINLAETNYLKETTLADSTQGYVVSGIFSPSINSIFADNEISKEGYKLKIKDSTGKVGEAEEVGAVLEVLGAKVTSILEGETTPTDCVVKSKILEVSKKVARIFDCSTDSSKMEGNFDIEITIGQDFADRF